MTATTASYRLLSIAFSDLLPSPFGALLSKRGHTSPGKNAVQRVDQSIDSAMSGVHDPKFNDPTEYPDSEVMSREPVETEASFQLMGVLRRYFKDLEIVAFVGSDNFFYWAMGDNRKSVSPDVYVLEGIPQEARPTQFPGSKEEQCWKTWIHHTVPSLAVEVKARRNPRKDELQSPKRHDDLGTKELIVFDPFYRKRRRADRKRFVVWRRNAEGALVIVHGTNDDRVYSQALDAHLLAQGDMDTSLLRLAVGPHGEDVLPFDSDLAEMMRLRAKDEARLRQEEARLRQEEALRADEEARLRQEESRRADEEARLRQEEARRADEEARLRQEEALRADEEARLRQEESRRADEEARLRQEESRRADEALRRAAELEAELARLRASTGKRRKR